eukprot:2330004-Prymnesium_polylepis.1
MQVYVNAWSGKTCHHAGTARTTLSSRHHASSTTSTFRPRDDLRSWTEQVQSVRLRRADANAAPWRRSDEARTGRWK